MIESEYRAWSKKNQKMYRVNELCQTRDGYFHGCVDDEFEVENQPSREELKKGDYVGRVKFVRTGDDKSRLSKEDREEVLYLMQYSGLCGTYIGDHLYESDIVAYEDEYGDSNLGEVIKERGAFYFRPISRYKKNDILLSTVALYCEKIGTIYEDTELLQV